MLDRDQNRCTRIKKSWDISPFGAGSNPIGPTLKQKMGVVCLNERPSRFPGALLSKTRKNYLELVSSEHAIFIVEFA